MSTTEPNSYDADEWGQYRSLSSMAVIAFVLGLCSVAMFAGPLLVIVPLAAVSAALLALKAISASGGGLSGARLAWWGLALAIVFGVASSARVKVRDLILQRQADRVGQQWLSIAAEGRTEELMDLMTRSAAQKLTPAVEPGTPMPFFGGILASALLRQDPFVLSLAELKESGNNSFRLDDSGVDATGKPVQAVLRYVAFREGVAFRERVAPGEGAEQTSYQLVLKRFRAPNLEAIWLVDSWSVE